MTDFTDTWELILTVNRTAEDRFEAPPAPSAFERLYGGQVAAQCLLAAAETVEPDRPPHSTHTCYLRGGDPRKPIEFDVRRLRDSRTLATRLVSAEQEGRLLATSTVSFQVPGDVLEHETSVVAPAPDPRSLPRRADTLVAAFGQDIPPGAGADIPKDIRYVDQTPWELPVEGGPPRNRLWTRILGALPDGDPVAHAAALTYVTDFPMYEPVLFPGGTDWRRMIAGEDVYGASLDHCVWFHRPARVDDWLLLEQYSPIATRSRGLCRAEAHQPGTGLVATVVQEMAWVRAALNPAGRAAAPATRRPVSRPRRGPSR